VTDPDPPRSAWAEAVRLSDLGLRLVASVVVGVFGGLWLDRRLGWSDFPWFALAGSTLGFTAGMIALVRGLNGRNRR
jgi:F0F1-type ATP synthase assembly protein I